MWCCERAHSLHLESPRFSFWHLPMKDFQINTGHFHLLELQGWLSQGYRLQGMSKAVAPAIDEEQKFSPGLIQLSKRCPQPPSYDRGLHPA